MIQYCTCSTLAIPYDVDQHNNVLVAAAAALSIASTGRGDATRVIRVEYCCCWIKLLWVLLLLEASGGDDGYDDNGNMAVAFVCVKNSGRRGVPIFETMRAVLKLHLESGSYGPWTSFRCILYIENIEN